MKKIINKKVLIVSCYFPPYGGGGVQRTVKFVKYLSRFGWRSIVLTVDKKGLIPVSDHTLVKDIPITSKIYRTNTLQPVIKNRVLKLIFSLISIPDPGIWWLPYALIKIIQINRIEKPNILYATGGPFSNIVIANIANRLIHKPLIIDLRDPWVLDYAYKKIKWTPHYWIQYWMYLNCLNRANQVIVATKGIKKQIKQRFGNQFPITVITNGYDEDDFKQLPQTKKKKNDKFVICHAGTFSATRKPVAYFRALKIIKNEQPSIFHAIHTNFIGQNSDVSDQIIQNFHLSGSISYKGYLSHKKALEYMNNANCLLLIVNRIPDSYVVDTGKVFEYIAFRKRIIAISDTESGAANILRETELGFIISEENPSMIAKVIACAFLEWKNHIKIGSNNNAIKKYSREVGARKLASILNSNAKYQE